MNSRVAACDNIKELEFDIREREWPIFVSWQTLEDWTRLKCGKAQNMIYYVAGKYRRTKVRKRFQKFKIWFPRSTRSDNMTKWFRKRWVMYKRSNWVILWSRKVWNVTFKVERNFVRKMEAAFLERWRHRTEKAAKRETSLFRSAQDNDNGSATGNNIFYLLRWALINQCFLCTIGLIFFLQSFSELSKLKLA